MSTLAIFRRAAASLAVLGSVAFAVNAGATSVVKVDTEDLAHIADLIVIGQVESVTMQEEATSPSIASRTIRTHNRVKVSEIWKGRATKGDIVDVLDNGGIAHGIVGMTHRSFVAGSRQLHEHTLSFVVRCDAECCKSHCKRARVAVHFDNQCRGLFGQCAKPFRSHKPSIVDEDKAIADAFEFAEQMGRDENGHAELVAGALDEREHLLTTGWIKAIGRLVENEQSWIVHERLRELHALRHASRIAAHRSVAFFKQSDVTQYFGRTLARSALGQTGTAREPGDELRCAHVRRQTIVLGHVPDEAPNRRSLAHDLVPQQCR